MSDVAREMIRAYGMAPGLSFNSDCRLAKLRDLRAREAESGLSATTRRKKSVTGSTLFSRLPLRSRYR